METFDGATHWGPNDEPVKAVQWKRDGDHPLVDRYPIEKRDWKGILRADHKLKFALKFGDWVCENEKGRLYVVSRDSFDLNYRQIGAVSPMLSVIITLLAVVYALIFGLDTGGLPLFLGVTHLMYYSALLAQWNGTANAVFDLDEAVDDMRVSAHTNTYAISQDTHNFWDDTTNEVTGTNYTTGGDQIDTQALTRSTNTVTFDGVDVAWLQSGTGFSTARKFVVYRYNAVAGSAPLFSVVTADADVGNVTGDLTVAWNASGIATWTTT